MPHKTRFQRIGPLSICEADELRTGDPIDAKPLSHNRQQGERLGHHPRAVLDRLDQSTSRLRPSAINIPLAPLPAEYNSTWRAKSSGSMPNSAPTS